MAICLEADLLTLFKASALNFLIVNKSITVVIMSQVFSYIY